MSSHSASILFLFLISLGMQPIILLQSSVSTISLRENAQVMCYFCYDGNFFKIHMSNIIEYVFSMLNIYHKASNFISI